MTKTLNFDHLPAALKTIVIEQKRGEYKDFHLDPADPYPLKGVTYPVDYGYLPGYIGEDGAELDFFVGSDIEGRHGSIVVSRADAPQGEHKFYVGLTETELKDVLAAFAPVLAGHEFLASPDKLLPVIQLYKTQVE